MPNLHHFLLQLCFQTLQMPSPRFVVMHLVQNFPWKWHEAARNNFWVTPGGISLSEDSLLLCPYTAGNQNQHCSNFMLPTSSCHTVRDIRLTARFACGAATAITDGAVAVVVLRVAAETAAVQLSSPYAPA